MKCKRCGKRLKKGYTHNGQIYGPKCVLKVGGVLSDSKKIKIKDGKEKDKQGDLFDD